MSGSSSMVRTSVVLVGVVLGWCASSLQAQPDEPQEPTQEEIQQQRYLESQHRNFEYRMENQQYHLAFDIAMHLHELEPEGGVAALNAARVLSQIGDSKKALEWLEIAVDSGFSHTQLLRNDRALVTVSTRPEFNDILARSEENRIDQFEKIKEEYRLQDFHSFVPPTYDPANPPPLIVALHGRGVDSANFFEPWIQIATTRGALLVAPRAPRPAGDGFAWMYEDEADWVVMHTIERVLEERPFDTSKIILTGFDEGARVAFNVAMAHPHEIHGVIPIAGHYAFNGEVPDDLAREEWPRFFFMVGSTDPLRMVAREVSKAMLVAEYSSEYLEFVGTGHSLPDQYEFFLLKSLDWVLEE